MATKVEAKEAVMGIAKEYGFIQPSSLDEIGRINPALRREIEESMLAKDKKIAHSIITLAKNIYSSNARFVFELLQNADDNQFGRARARGELPFIAFHAFSDRIVIECNEDGFTKQNLAAICSVGESTKAASHGYIGAKGIGFKSVFIAAWKVEIQSGNYAFYFKHNREDIGLGMVLPVWQDVDSDDIPDSLTRMTLHLHQNGDSDEIQHLHSTIFEQFTSLEETCLLFLRNLKEIRVSFYTADEELRESRRFYLEGDPSWKVSLNVESVDEHGDESIQVNDYYVSRYIGTGLPKSDNREIPTSPEAREASARAETILAFPVDQENCPILQPQSVFAFLPIRKTSFKFLIQSDFDTNASRQDISESSRRNAKLLDHIASAFCQAVSYFAFDKDMSYTWPAYLPSFDEAVANFWVSLPLNIRAQLSGLPVICTRHDRLKRITDTVRPTGDFKDSDENVLLDRADIDSFISDHYSPLDCNRLVFYGLEKMSCALVIKLLKKDLESPLSRMRSRDLSDEIHSCMAILLARFPSNLSSDLRSLELLPLGDGTWVSPNSGPVYFPTTRGIIVPPSLGFRTLDSSASKNEYRHTFFSKVGVNEVDVSLARAVAFQRNLGFTSAIQSKEQLVFLYLTHGFSEAGNRYDLVRVFCQGLFPQRPSQEDCYIPSDHPYGPERLLESSEMVPGLEAPLLSSIYLEDIPETPSDTHPSWRRWLERDIGVRKNLSVIAKSGRSLSDAWNYLSEHRPDKLLGLLKHVWPSQGKWIHEDELRRKCLREADASRLCEVELPGACQLQEAYLPFPHLMEHFAQFSENDIVFPFLSLGDSEMETITSNWLFLHTSLGVKKDENLDFYLDILKWLALSNPDPSDIVDFQKVFSLYGAIQSKLVGTRDRAQLREQIELFFQCGNYILVPGCSEARVSGATWVTPGLCLWEAPQNMITRYSLEAIYRQSVTDKSHLSYITDLFTQTLQIESASWSDLIDELTALKYEESPDVASILEVYKYLHEMNTFLFLNPMRQRFHMNALIFVTGDSGHGWYKSSECLWSSTTEIRGMVTIQDDYEELKEFFIDTLGVRTLTLQMAYDDLLESSSQEEVNMDQIISKIWCLNALLSTDDTYVDPRPLLRNPIFPVLLPNGSTTVCSTDTTFAIPDREHLASRFRGKISMLDFTQEEVRSLRRFFDWTNLSHCYLSDSVRELTSISGDPTPFTPSPTRDIKRKAHAILRVAATFKSPRYHADGAELFELLRTASVEVADDIVTILRISQGSTPVDVEERVAKLHLLEDSSLLSIYLPRDRKAQELCFCDLLPKRIVDWLMRDPVTQILEPIDGDMVKIMIMIFSIHPSACHLVLDREGMAEVGIANDDVEDDIEDDFRYEASHRPDTSDEGDVSQFTSVETLSTATIQNHQPSIQGSPRHFTAESYSSGPSYDRPVPISSPDRPLAADNSHYLRLLNHVVESARRASFPSNGAFDMSQLHRALSGSLGAGYIEGFDGPDVRNAFRSDSQPERDRKVGAAGELYAFELLSRIDPPLPGWSQQNWQSTIRRYVTIHPEYATMDPWYGRESADIVYNDIEGTFTSFLIDHGYLEAGEWESRCPKYFIEIKTTTGPLGTPFYMSRRQFERMGTIHDTPTSSEVYLILRVFDIRGSNIGMCMYLDPEQLRRDGGLLFTGETWSVVPG